MSFHITFEDGSNPYYSFPSDPETHRKNLRKWRRNYDLELVGKIGGMEIYHARAKSRSARKDALPEDG